MIAFARKNVLQHLAPNLDLGPKKQPQVLSWPSFTFFPWKYLQLKGLWRTPFNFYNNMPEPPSGSIIYNWCSDLCWLGWSTPDLVNVATSQLSWGAWQLHARLAFILVANKSQTSYTWMDISSSAPIKFAGVDPALSFRSRQVTPQPGAFNPEENKVQFLVDRSSPKIAARW